MRTQLSVITIALVGLAAPIANAAPTIHYGPIISRGATPDKMIVHWGTAASGDSPTVSYRVKGTATVLTATAVHGCANSSSNCDYEATLPSLTEGTEYEYAIAGNAIDGTLHFGTCPAAGQPLDVVFYGDSRSGGSVHQMVAGNVLAKGADIVFESGDIQLDGQYANYWSASDTGGQPGFFVGGKNLVSVIPFMAVPGNHEHGQIGTTDVTKNYELLFPNPAHPLGTGAGGGVDYYSFTCAGVMFIGLDGNSPGTTQNNWLTSQLAAAKGDANISHVFVWFHQSPYSLGSHGDYGPTQVWTSGFEDATNKVRAVFTGHDHNYQRLQHGGLTYIVAGGAGADLYTMNASDTAGATVLGKSKSYNFVKLHITKDFITGAAFDGTTGNPLTSDVTSMAETFTLYGSPSDMGGGGSGGSGGGGGTGGTGGSGGGGTGGSGGGGSGGGTGTGGNANNGMGGCSVAGAGSVGAPLLIGFALIGLALRRRRRA